MKNFPHIQKKSIKLLHYLIKYDKLILQLLYIFIDRLYSFLNNSVHIFCVFNVLFPFDLIKFYNINNIEYNFIIAEFSFF